MRNSDFHLKRLFYLNTEKVCSLYAQLYGELPQLSKNSTKLGANMSIRPMFTVGAGLGASTSKSQENIIPADALAIRILEKIRKSRGYVPHTQPRKLAKYLRAKSTSILATIEGKFSIADVPEPTAEEDWLQKLMEPGYVSIGLSSQSNLFKRTRKRIGIDFLWLSMNTAHIIEQRAYHGGHIAVVLRRSEGSLQLSVTGWIEPSGYINPLVVYW